MEYYDATEVHWNNAEELELCKGAAALRLPWLDEEDNRSETILRLALLGASVADAVVTVVGALS